MFNIELDSLQEAIMNSIDEKTQIKSIIQNLMRQIEDNTQKKSELYFLGKFINRMKEKHIEIVNTIHESPDFLIKHDNELVGVEIIEAKDSSNTGSKTTNDLLAKAAIRFQDKYPGIIVFVEFTFKNSELKINRNNRTNLIEELCDAVYNTYLGRYDFPSFIDGITIVISKVVSFYQLEIGYINEIDSHQIIKLIMKKECLLEKYKTNSCTEKQWLLIVTSKVAQNSFDIENVKEMSFRSKFNRVYLLEEFTSELKRLA